MYFERKAYLKELISAEGNGMIKIITGIRRCGKSFLLFNIFRKHLLERGVAEDVEEKEGFTTSANAGDNLYHPIAFCRDEFFQVCFTFKIHSL